MIKLKINQFLYRKTVLLISLVFVLSILLSCTESTTVDSDLNYDIITQSNTYNLVEQVYPIETKAAVSFYKNNIKTLKQINKNQEMLGWIIKCPDGYRVTTVKIGELSNRLNPPKVMNKCSVIAHLHTHPVPDRGLTSDFFSPADLKSSTTWKIYLLAQESCRIRYTYKPDKPKGIYVETLWVCK